jgi:uncharacterized protein (DUF2384 family)
MNKRIRKKLVRRVLLVELAARFESPDEAIEWLEKPAAELEGRTPREAIAAGEAERVALLLDAQNRASGKA